MRNQPSMTKVIPMSAERADHTGADVERVSPAQRRAMVLGELQQLKDRMLDDYLAKCADAKLGAAIRAAANEAAAIASINPYPLLVFPVLFEEKAAWARRYHKRQQLVKDSSRRLILAAA